MLSYKHSLSFLSLCAPGKHLDDVNARTLHKSSGHNSNHSADYALVDMMATSLHPLHYSSSHGDDAHESSHSTNSTMTNRGGEIDLPVGGPQATHTRNSLASQHKKGKGEYSF